MPPSFSPCFLCLRTLFATILVVACSTLSQANTADLRELWRERVKAVVAVEFYIETEIERRPTVTGGTVIDREGTVILQPAAIQHHVPASQLKDLRVYRPGQPVSEFAKAEYLGPDPATGWHFIRVDPKAIEGVVPITDFVVNESPQVQVTDQVWGIGLRGKDEDFEPYFMTNRVALVIDLPHRTAVALGQVTAPQLPVFDSAGAFVGLGLAGFGESYYQYSRTERGSPILLVSSDEARVFRVASEVLPYLSRIPKNQSGRPVSWLGAIGLQPVSPEVAKYLKLENQSALVVSEVLEDSPAQKAGLLDRDIIVEVDGVPLPRLKPAQVVSTWMERELALRKPGDAVRLSVLRGTERVELTATLAEEPKMLREAERKYFDRLGFTAREFLFVDVVAHRIKDAERTGVVAHFVKNNSPAAAAGLRAEDWIREIDGAEIATFEQALEKLTAIEQDLSRGEFILLTSRGGETSVLRVKLR